MYKKVAKAGCGVHDSSYGTYDSQLPRCSES